MSVFHCECVHYLLSVLGMVNEYLPGYCLPPRERRLTPAPLRECLGECDFISQITVYLFETL